MNINRAALAQSKKDDRETVKVAHASDFDVVLSSGNSNYYYGTFRCRHCNYTFITSHEAMSMTRHTETHSNNAIQKIGKIRNSDAPIYRPAQHIGFENEGKFHIGSDAAPVNIIVLTGKHEFRDRWLKCTVPKYKYEVQLFVNDVRKNKRSFGRFDL